MKKNIFKISKRLLLLIIVCFSFALTVYSDNQIPYRRPNIIFILADDLGYGDCGCYGQDKISTPNIDRLAVEGIRFTQAYAGGPVCTPSRCVLMTGLHNGHGAARDNIPHYHTYLEDKDFTIAEMLKEAGYHCGGVGKWSLGDNGTIGSATNQGFDMWFGYLNQDHAHYYYTNYLNDSYRKENDSRFELPYNSESRKFYSHDLLTERALQFIRDSYDQSFFLYAAYTLPHYSAESEDKDRFAVPSTDPYTEKDWDSQSKKYAAMLHMLDRDIGRIVDLVEELNLSGNTLIIFTSDNGGHSILWDEFDTNGPLRGYKRDLTEGGIRVPFIARWPGKIPAGLTNNTVIAFQDMMPTFADLAGIQTPENIDGISVLPAFMGEGLTEERNYLYWDYGHCRDIYSQALRYKNWKGIRYGENGKIQLYDLENDIGEENDLSNEHPEIVFKIDKFMKEAFVPNERYTIGEKYTGGPIWKKEDQE